MEFHDGSNPMEDKGEIPQFSKSDGMGGLESTNEKDN